MQTGAPPIDTNHVSLFQADDRVPAHLVDQLQKRSLRVKRIQKQDVEKTAPVHLRQTIEQTKSSRVLTLARLKPLDGKEWLDWAVDDLTTDSAMVILRLLDLATGLILQGHAALQATVTATAETGQHLDAVQRRHQAPLDSSLIEGLAAFQTAVDIHQHGFQRVQVEAAQTVPQSVVAESALGADPALQVRMRQFAV